MHMADALVAPAVAATMYGCSTIAAGYSVRRVTLENETKKIPVMGVMGAFVFATQMINFTIPGTGSSGHLCGGMLLSAMLGPFAGFLTMIGVLLIQCLLFADGGILALGCNVWNMAFYGCFIGALLIWRPMIKGMLSQPKAKVRRNIIISSIVGCVLTLQLGAFSVTLETLASGITELPFKAFVATMQPIHLAIGLVEGLITAAVLLFVYEARPELLWGVDGDKESAKGKFSFKTTIITLIIAAVLIGGGLSLFASENPDGLEWSLEKITGDTELDPQADANISVYESAEEIVENTAILPDYSFKNSETAAGTSFSGIVGGAIVLVLCIAIGSFLKMFKKKNNATE